MREFKIYDPDTRQDFTYTAEDDESAARRYAEDFNDFNGEALVNEEKLILVDGKRFYIYAATFLKFAASPHRLHDDEYANDLWRGC